MKRRLLASALAIAMSISSFTFVSFAEETADETDVIIEESDDEALSDSAVDADSEEASEETEETAAAESTSTATSADLADSDVVSWTIGATRTVSTSAATASYDSDGNLSTLVLAPNGSGKCSTDDEEYLYTITEVESSMNFVLEADMTVDKLFTNATGSTKQTTAGLVIMSDPSSSAFSDGTASNRHEEGMMLKIYRESDSVFGFSQRTLDEGASEATENVFFDVDDFDAGGTNLGTWHLTLSKSATTYSFKVEDSDGNSKTVYYDTTTMFGDTFYPGFMAARDITVTFTNISFIADANQYTDVTVVSEPTQTEYYVGENINTDGLVVQVTYIDGDTGEEKTEIIDDYVVSGFDSSSTGDKTLLVGKAGVYASIPYTVRKIRVTAVNVTREPIKNEYYEYQILDADGLTGKFVFEDGSTETIGYSDVYDDDGLVIGEERNFCLYVDGEEVYDLESYFTSADAKVTTLDIGYLSTDTKDDYGVVYSAPLTIHSLTLTELTVTVRPTKREYVLNEEYLQSGLVIKGIYTDGSSLVYDYFEEYNYDVTGFDSSALGTVTLTATLNTNTSYTVTFDVYIVEKLTTDILITRYPRTTYTNDMTVSEIGETIRDGLAVSVEYNDDTMDELTGCSVTENSSLTALNSVCAEYGTYDLTSGDYYVDLSELTAAASSNGTVSNGTYTVYAVPTELEYDALEFSVTVWDSTTHFWRRTVFGQSSGNSTWTNLSDPDETGFSESINLKSWNGAGKITTGGNDGLVYYYTRFDPDNNFTLKGDVEVVQYLATDDKSRSAQEGFGIQFRDTISLLSKEDGEYLVDAYNRAGITLSDGSTFDGEDIFYEILCRGGYSNGTSLSTSNKESWSVSSSAITAYRDSSLTPVATIDEAYIDKYGEPVPIRNNSTQEYSNMVLAGTFTAGSYPTDSSASSYYFNTHKQRINMYIRTGVTEAYSTNQTAVVNYGPYCLYGTTGDEPTGEFYPKTGDVYTISLSRINGGYYESCTIKTVGDNNADFRDEWEGKTFYKAWYWGDEEIESDPLLDNDDTVIYTGFVAARWAEVNVSNIEWYDSSTETDKVYKEEEDDVKTPTITITSPLYTKKTDYSLKVKINNKMGGIATIKVNDKVVASGVVLSTKALSFDVTLNENSTNSVYIVYKPNQNDTLSSYDTVTLSETITCCSEIYSETEDLYVAPDVDYTGYDGVLGTPGGTGERNSPLNIDSAIALVNYGQKIIVLDGIYYRDDTVLLYEANFGFESAMKYLWADEGATPVFDMQDGPEGLHAYGDWWWVKGLSFMNAKDNNKGGALAASNCIIDNCKFYENGTTGFQVSGSGSDAFYEWPARNLIVYCEVYNNQDSSGNNADGFGCKLTVGNGNVFKNCVSHHNLDDGWDFYSKTISGYIGATVLEDCISYKCTYYLNADGSEEEYFKGSGNGFKMGGDSMYIQHYVKDCIAFQNENTGFSSNANPALKFRNCVGWKNGGANFSLYTGLETSKQNYNYNLDGCISVNNGSADSLGTVNRENSTTALLLYDENGELVYDDDGNTITVTDANGDTISVPVYPNAAETDILIDSLLESYPEAAEAINNYSLTINHLSDLMAVAAATDPEKKAIIDIIRTDKNVPIISDTNYWILTKGSSSQMGTNASGESWESDWFESTNVSDMVTNGFIAQNEDGSYIRNGFLVRAEGHEYEYDEDGYDIPDYPAVYYVKFPDAETAVAYSSAGSVEETETTTAAKKSSGGGGGGSSSVRKSTETADEADDSSSSSGSSSSGSSGSSSSGGSYDGSSSGSSSASSFKDISSRPWAEEAINALSKAGIISGVSSTEFEPDKYITRADFCVMISRALGYTGGGSTDTDFDDIDTGKYYASYVAYAADAGLVTGYDDGSFKPENYISRQEMMTVIARLLGADGTEDTAANDVFTDKNDISAWAAPYVAHLADSGIINGTDTGLLPLEYITRAQAAVLVYNAIVKSEEAEAEEEAEEADDSSEAAEADEAIEEETEAESDEEEAEDSEETEDETDETEASEEETDSDEAAVVEESTEETA
ncbi:MAG: S-layer homology domain-containing protein [Clostridiales bacterium]|nr:S-layer homology domain-containing protein [Clostridiales bacterium]